MVGFRRGGQIQESGPGGPGPGIPRFATRSIQENDRFPEGRPNPGIWPWRPQARSPLICNSKADTATARAAEGENYRKHRGHRAYATAAGGRKGSRRGQQGGQRVQKAHQRGRQEGPRGNKAGKAAARAVLKICMHFCSRVVRSVLTFVCIFTAV